MSSYIALGAACYAAVALLCAAATFLEGWHANARWNAGRIAGLLACALWPVTFLTMLTVLGPTARGSWSGDADVR